MRPPTGVSPRSAIFRRALRDARVRTIAFAYLFAGYSYIQPVGYRHAYPTLASRIAFAHSFAHNAGLRLFYGYPYDVTTVRGYTAWRVGGTLAIVAGVFGLLAAVRALRTEEDAGRMELVLSGAVGRHTAFTASMLAVAAGTALQWLAAFAGFALGGLPAGGAAYLALVIASVVPVLAGVGALASQLASTRRLALELGGVVVAAFWLARVIADTVGGAGWLRWLTPLGWAEEMRPFASPHPLVLLLPAATSALLLVAAARIAAVRDMGTGLLAARDTAPARTRLLSGPASAAFRGERTGLIVWTASVAGFAFIFGVVADSVSSAGISKSIQRELAKLGTGSIATPSGYLAFVFLFFILVVSLFACAQIGAARHEEADEQLETVLAQPVGRIAWLRGRLLLAAAAVVTLSALTGLFTWFGAAAGGVGVSLARTLEASVNCIPVALLFLGFGVLAYAALPRASAGISYGLVTIAFLWQLIGSVLGVPGWMVKLTPFAHVGLVPAQAFRPIAAAVMLGIGFAAAAAALTVFRRRDLLGA